MDSSVSPKEEIWFLRVCHHISNAVYEVFIYPKTYRTAVRPTRREPLPGYNATRTCSWPLSSV